MSPIHDPVAVRLPLEPGPAIDPFALAGGEGILFLSDDRVLVGLGCATTLPLRHGLDDPAELEEAGRRLASIPCDDRLHPDSLDGHGRDGRVPRAAVVAFGALPFDRSAGASLVVPEILFAREPTGEEWIAVVAADPSRLPVRPGSLRSWLFARSAAGGATADGVPARPRAHPAVTALSTELSPESFETMVDEALSAIGDGGVAKVVLARQIEVTASETFDITGLARRWHRLEPHCAIFSMPDAEGRFVGASPELLVERSGLSVCSRPLAGTTYEPAGASGRAEGSAPDGESLLPPELLASEKDRVEHRLVVEAIAERLGPLCSSLDVPSGPDLVHLHNLVHLGTSLSGTLAPAGDRPAPSALELVGTLHPTPAVGGVPTDAARSLIATLEPQTRGRYAGPVGYLDSAGDGRWVLGIRAVSIHGRTARLTAGVGIVAGSDPRTELAETNLKFNAVLDALAPGCRLAMPAGRGGRARVGQPAIS